MSTPEEHADAPMNIQIALQGGGAKMAGLIAAMEAVQDLEGEGLIRVTRVAGTSAGSIVGTMFAAGVPMGSLRDAVEAVNLKPFTGRTSKWGFYWRAFFGNPIFPEKTLADELQRLLDELPCDPTEVDTIGELSRTFDRGVHLTATNLRSKGLIECKDDDSTIHSILDSCALPFLFRGYNSPHATVLDGGICENLPTELLYDYEDDDGPVIALSFAPKYDSPPETLKEYILALVETVTNRSRDRARRRIPGRIHTIRTRIGTLDFEEAFSPEYREGEHETIRRKADLFFRGLVDARDQGPSDDSGRTSGELLGGVTDPDVTPSSAEAVMMRRIWRVHMALRTDAEVVFPDYEMSVIANSLATEAENPSRTLDEVRTSMKMTARKAPVWGYGFQVSSAAHETVLYENTCRVMDNNGEDVLAAVLPMSDPDKGGLDIQRFMAFFFSRPLLPDSEPFDIRFVDTIENFVGPLREEGVDRFWISIRNSMVQTARIILHVPASFGRVRPTDNSQPSERIRPIDEQQRAHYEQHSPRHFRAFGWECVGLAPGERFEIELERVRDV